MSNNTKPRVISDILTKFIWLSASPFISTETGLNDVPRFCKAWMVFLLDIFMYVSVTTEL